MSTTKALPYKTSKADRTQAFPQMTLILYRSVSTDNLRTELLITESPADSQATTPNTERNMVTLWASPLNILALRKDETRKTITCRSLVEVTFHHLYHEPHKTA